MDDDNKTVVKKNNRQSILGRFFGSKIDASHSVSPHKRKAEEHTTGNRHDLEINKDNQAPQNKKISPIKAAIGAFVALFFIQFVILNFQTMSYFYGPSVSGAQKMIQPFFTGMLVILAAILMTKASVYFFGREKTYGTYLPTAVTLIIMIVFFKGCVYWMEHWGTGSW